ncbi:MAG: hypothetical protein ACI8XM_003042, partial [Haloarculaceae archaeon]
PAVDGQSHHADEQYRYDLVHTAYKAFKRKDILVRFSKPPYCGCVHTTDRTGRSKSLIDLY